MADFKEGDVVYVKTLTQMRKTYTEPNGAFTPTKFIDTYIDDSSYNKRLGQKGKIMHMYSPFNTYPYSVSFDDANNTDFSAKELTFSSDKLSFKPLY